MDTNISIAITHLEAKRDKITLAIQALRPLVSEGKIRSVTIRRKLNIKGLRRQLVEYKSINRLPQSVGVIVESMKMGDTEFSAKQIRDGLYQCFRNNLIKKTGMAEYAHIDNGN